MTTPRRALAVAALALSAAALSACDDTKPGAAPGGPVKDDAADVAVAWFDASARGDAETWCKLDESGAKDMAKCIQSKSSESEREPYLRPATVLAAHDWTRQDGTKGRAIVLRRHPKGNPENMTPTVVGVAKVREDPEHWRVVEIGSYKGDPANREQVVAELNKREKA